MAWLKCAKESVGRMDSMGRMERMESMGSMESIVRTRTMESIVRTGSMERVARMERMLRHERNRCELKKINKSDNGSDHLLMKSCSSGE